jgi:hypothetical protein
VPFKHSGADHEVRSGPDGGLNQDGNIFWPMLTISIQRQHMSKTAGRSEFDAST